MKSEKPFVSKHVQYDEILDDPNAGIDFLSGFALLKEAKSETDRLTEKENEPILKDRLRQLQQHLA
ncbi:hypothetical protein, partial [Pseudomonas sp. Kh7]|uniref:hypothetical protein n=1 Tax=Pseudomonas sp. Kh7 TaxID=2093743 RepID=UPI001184BDA9